MLECTGDNTTFLQALREWVSQLLTYVYMASCVDARLLNLHWAIPVSTLVRGPANNSAMQIACTDAPRTVGQDGQRGQHHPPAGVATSRPVQAVTVAQSNRLQHPTAYNIYSRCST